MGSKEEFQTSAEKIFSYWQKQMSDMAKDPDMLSKSMELFYTMQKNCMNSFTQTANSESDNEHSATNPPSSVDAYDDATRDESVQRIAELERRVAVLESLLLKYITAAGEEVQ